STSLVVLLALTTPWSELLAALRALFVPRLFVLVLGMAYRYVFQLVAVVGDMYTARQARTVRRDRDTRGADGRRFVAASAGALFAKAQSLSEEVHMAMVARGYTGDHRTLTPRRLRAADLAFVAGCLLSAALVLGADRVVA